MYMPLPLWKLSQGLKTTVSRFCVKILYQDSVMISFCHDVKILCYLKLLLTLTKGGHSGGQVGYTDTLV